MDDQDYNIEFVDPPPYDCNCPICLEMFKDKVCYQTKCCGNHICSDCATRLKNMKSPCAVCRSGSFDVTEDQFFTRQFLSLKVRCYYSNAGCKWTGELRQLDEHEKKCTKNIVKCQYCNENYHRGDNEHLLTCHKANAIVTCPNCCSNPQQKRDTIKAHLENECPLRVITPPNGALPITANGETSIVPVSFTMLDYLKHLESGQPWYSPPFYTRENGYKLSIRVDAKLNKESNHLSVHVCVLKGEYDDQLQWPIHAEVRVSLLNWKGIAKSLYLPGDEYCKQVLVDEIIPLGKGIAEFVSNENLKLILNKNMKELSCKCLSFRVESVRILPMPQVIPDWAKCNCMNYFVINSFKRMKKEEHNEFLGSSFYTHKNGYKIELSVKFLPNGETGTDVYVTARVVEREHGNKSVWPFYGELGIDLINWRNDKNYKRFKITFHEYNQSDAVQSSVGILRLEEYSQLTYNSATNTEYLRNDCILFKVVIACTHQFTLDKFNTRKLNQDIYHTEPFFANGYKMQISVEANNNGYIGVYAHLIKGPNNDKLIWPFCGDVVVELVNWIEDNDHHKYVIELSPEVVTNNVCDRVLVGDRSAGHGTSKFIQCSAIKPQFLQDDCLYFRVEVVIHSKDLSLKTLKWQNPQSLSPLIEFNVTNVSKRKEHNTTFYSPAFYSHNEGYKLRLEVERSSDQQHIGIFARLLRGQHDDNLVWPFQASIVVELVNWKEDANHHSYTISFNERTPIQYKSQVTEGERAPSGWGTHTFISYSSLDNTNTEYLQDDCLRFRVKEIVIYSTPHCVKKPPWLEEASNSFIITHFSDQIRLQDIYWSPPFYTSARGYRMCLKVCPGKGTHVSSIYGYLMKGDYDDELNWPFTADVVVDILNWKRDNNHHRVILLQNESCERLYGNEMKCVSNKSNALAVQTPSSSNRQYLSEDCMCIRIYVVINSNQLLNKTPCWNQSSTPALEFTLNKFTLRSSYENHYYSKPFFTSGYQMQICVKANVNGYIGVYVHLMKGPNDDKLIWPFCGDVVVELVNWIEDNDHHRYVTQLSPEVVTGNACDRVLVGDRSKGWGPPKFIQHSAIKPQFLQDDCLYFRVKEVVVHSNELSLKTPKWQNPQSLSPLIEFTVTNVSKRKEHNTTFYSPALHSHNDGYKLRLEVDRSSDQQYIGIFARLLRGQHDDNLVWPFQASIVVELVNWREDANHHSHTISFNEHTPIKCKSQVTEGEWAPSVCGTDTFISYSSLDYNSNTKTEYLQDDCLRIRIAEIVIYSTPVGEKKPLWLEEAAHSFNITNFTIRIRLQEEYWSPPFYTSVRGYRMCLNVYPAGNGTGKGTHVSMFGYLMKGDYDNKLNWPFTADVVIDILNWRGDNNHHIVVCKFNEGSPDDARARVYDDNEVAPSGQCNAKAIEISTLMSSTSSDPQYLSEDCMCIRIHDVVIYNTQLLNMTPCWSQSSTSALEFNLNKFTLRSSYKNHYYSKPFFASGYKMQISVEANANGYIGVYACLMKGPNDDNLIWPFCGDVVVELVNWIEDNNHHRRVIHLSPEKGTSNVCDRVLVGDRSPGWGYPKFIQHSAIKPQFLQDDCLYFRVKEVVIHSNELSLKTPKWQNPQSLSPLIEFTVTNVSKRKEHNTTFYSPAFHNEGYKLRLEVERSSDQQHIGIYARLLRGQHDDNLVWPFQASIVVELVNWREDANHHSYTISFNERTPIQYKSQVTEGERAPSGWGTHTFISYSSLDNTNTEYLQDDCLRFRVKEIVIYSTPHCVKKPPWLEEASNSFTITRFSDRIRLHKDYWSPLFYTSVRGYRMCLNVCPAGNGTGKRTHVSIFGNLMKGDYDDELNWPFSADVVVDILNWRRDNNHHRVVCKFNEDSPDDACARVYDDDKLASSRGSQKTIEISSLMSSSLSDPQYLSEDCVCIRVHDVVLNSNQILDKTPCWNQSSTSALEFTLNKFTLRSSYDNCYYSKPFFTSGYKMQICVHANANGYIGVYVHLMKGPNDDILIWPFCGDVVAELVNWNEDKDHRKYVIQLSSEVVTGNACDRVLVGDRSAGWGKSKLIQHSSIKPQFLQNDCLYFRIKEVVIHSNELSLKTPKWKNPQSQSPLIKFTVTNVSKRKEHNTTFYSPAFHSHNKGYKLRLYVKRSSDQQHISLFARLLRGQHDDNLVWPFQASIVVELVNWREDANHHSYTISFNECTPIQNKSQVTEGEGEQASGWGTHTFISYSSLNKRNTEYLQDDCLRFRVKEIVIYSTPICVKKPFWQKEATNLFTITRFSDRIRLQEEYWSPPFYTSARGYRMCLKVCPGKGTRVSIYGYLMKGYYDNELNWPFTADMVIDILNWKRDNNNHRVVLQNGSCERLYGNEMKCVWNKSNALAVQIPSSSDPQYLLEDCMCIRIYVVINKTPCWNQSSTSALEFTLNKFSLRSSYSNHYYSKPFFTSGYQMQICVKANVNGYIGVYVHLMKGQNDDKLIWPFCGDVVVELVNWIEDKDHHRYVTQLSPEVVTGNACDRVLVGDRSNGWGPPKFIQHSAIKAQFLQDDCLYFRVKEVVVHSNELSLKTPKWQNPQSLSPLIEFTVTNVSKRKEHNTTFYSPAFHSHNEGYKLRLEVQRSPDQQHIGIYARLLRGQHDDNLVWPFQASIVVELINWREDANHHSYTISFNERTPIQYKSQVTEGERAPSGWGTHTFISYSSLDNTNTEYLQDDCLRFRVKEIVIYSTPHCVKKPPWLEEASNSFIITHFSDQIRLQDIYWSPPFYTSARGYKMCLRVHPTGYGPEGTCVHMFGYLMKGDYDDKLNWPFTADVVVDILNWRGDNNHHRVVIKFKNGARVHDDNKVTLNSYGNATEKCTSSSAQYLSEDCMCIRIHDAVKYAAPSWWHKPSVWQPEFTITGVSKHMNYNTSYISTPFYTHKKGYKMRLEVYPNGLDDEVGKHVSIYFCLLKGEYDNDLAWPMNIKMKVKILNWCKNDNHIMEICSIFDSRITDSSKTTVSGELPQFCTHSTLLTASEATKYIKDDCIRVWLSQYYE